MRIFFMTWHLLDRNMEGERPYRREKLDAASPDCLAGRRDLELVKAALDHRNDLSFFSLILKN